MGEPPIDGVSSESSESCVEYKAIVVFDKIAAGLSKCHFTKLLSNFAREVGRFNELKSLSQGKFFVSTDPMCKKPKKHVVLTSHLEVQITSVGSAECDAK